MDAEARGFSVVSSETGIGVSTLYRWAKTFRAEGVPGLVPCARKRGLGLSSEIQTFLNDKFLIEEKPNATTAYRDLVDFCFELRIPCPSKRSVQRYLSSIPPSVAQLKREGFKKWRPGFEPKAHRDLESLEPGDVFCGDHRRMDVFVRSGVSSGSHLLRPWVTAWMDLSSGAFVGATVCVVPSGDSIALALREAILHYGVPGKVYIDNGKDYRSSYLNRKQITARAEISSPAEYILSPGVLNELGVEVVHAQAYTPWSKPIEPAFKHVFSEWERTLPGWCGPSGNAKPDKLSREIKSGKLFTLSEFEILCAERVSLFNEAYSEHLGRSRLAPWAGKEVEVPDHRSLDLLMLRRKATMITHQGIRAFGSSTHPRYYWDDALALHVGSRVEYRYSPMDLSRIYIYRDSLFLCEALNQDAMKQGLDSARLKDLIRRKRSARAVIDSYTDSVSALQDESSVLEDLREAKEDRKVVGLDTMPRGAVLKKHLSLSDDFTVKRVTGPTHSRQL